MSNTSSSDSQSSIKSSSRFRNLLTSILDGNTFRSASACSTLKILSLQKESSWSSSCHIVFNQYMLRIVSSSTSGNATLSSKRGESHLST
uniref:Uncharacterized protein LOC8285801 n=1 Tax=Rhizophora mucronata TaxID=61149 RepID=A0A2P2MRJ3_RHIMU